MGTTHPDSRKLIHARNTPHKTPELSHKLDGYFKIFLLTLHFTQTVDTFLSTPYNIREASLMKFPETLNSMVK